jgi:hypothetical protein
LVFLQARAGIQIDYGHPIRITDVQNLIMWTLADGTSPHWAFLKATTIPLAKLPICIMMCTPQDIPKWSHSKLISHAEQASSLEGGGLLRGYAGQNLDMFMAKFEIANRRTTAR